MEREYDLAVCVKDTLWKEILAKTYRIALRDDFVGNANPKEHNLGSHLNGLVSLLKLNANQATKQPLCKRQIYVVSYGIWTGSEIIANRPSIIFKNSEFTKGDDVLVIPLTSAVRDKLADKFDIFVLKDNDNKLFQNSYARLRQVRAISIKRIGKLLGTITDAKVKEEINGAMKTMLGIDQ